ncbi:MAG: LytTR family transcriptional regulator DNA-binding domain-containing protein [Symbiobacterium sp.]|uniref:LytR/AlgR family response regulator transcription factor n=1 Tax=Symbiobacterium sp. TaxID=1971213 RepID=UPI003463F919
MVLRALIVDDEYPARMELRFQLSQFPDVEIIGEATNAREAMALINALEYDVIFLDVQMPGMTGLELAKSLKGRAVMPKVVFVTAYENYAVSAFEIPATDYLLKPIEAERLAETIQRLREAKGAAAEGKAEKAGEAARQAEEPKPQLSFLLCEKDDKQIPLPLNEIVYIFSEGYNVYVQTYSERLLTRHTLQELTERLPANQFFRSHRSYLVNIYQVKEISPYFNGAYIMKLKDKNHSEVIVSRANVKRMKQLFSMG